jgi:hypothetical protein
VRTLMGMDAAAPQDLWAPSVAIEAIAGVGAPTGLLGGGAELAPSRWFVVGAGVGVAMAGPQAAGWARVRVPLHDGGAVSFGGGLSGGNYDDSDPLIPLMGAYRSYHFTPAVWANLELGAEKRFASGLEVRAFAGVGLAPWLTEEAGHCTYHASSADDAADGPSSSPSGCSGTPPGGLFHTMLPYVGLSVGWYSLL